jgi:hypothetical protein
MNETEEPGGRMRRLKFFRRAMAMNMLKKVGAGVHRRTSMSMLKQEQAEKARMEKEREKDRELLLLPLSRMLLLSTNKEVRYGLAACINDLFPY